MLKKGVYKYEEDREEKVIINNRNLLVILEDDFVIKQWELASDTNHNLQVVQEDETRMISVSA